MQVACRTHLTYVAKFADDSDENTGFLYTDVNLGLFIRDGIGNNQTTSSSRPTVLFSSLDFTTKT
jgi:hypothetical protein